MRKGGSHFWLPPFIFYVPGTQPRARGPILTAPGPGQEADP